FASPSQPAQDCRFVSTVCEPDGIVEVVDQLFAKDFRDEPLEDRRTEREGFAVEEDVGIGSKLEQKPDAFYITLRQCCYFCDQASSSKNRSECVMTEQRTHRRINALICQPLHVLFKPKALRRCGIWRVWNYEAHTGPFHY